MELFQKYFSASECKSLTQKGLFLGDGFLNNPEERMKFIEFMNARDEEDFNDPYVGNELQDLRNFRKDKKL